MAGLWRCSAFEKNFSNFLIRRLRVTNSLQIGGGSEQLSNTMKFWNLMIP